MLTVNGVSIVSAKFGASLSNAWCLTADIPGEFKEGDSATVNDSETGIDWLGTIYSARLSPTGMSSLTVFGGKGGLRKTIAPSHFANTSAATVLAYICAQSGETLSPLIDASITSKFFASYTVAKSSTQVALAALAKDLGSKWRIFHDGGIWFGSGRFPGPQLLYDDVFDIASGGRVATAMPTGIQIWPGDENSFGQVSSVSYAFAADGRVRALVS